MALIDKNVMDSKLVGKIVHEVKSQGVFDEFRRNSIADVDTKPAYQNLRQRVESTVKKFLSEQKWSPDINKIQLRERLRKHITDSGFLDVGVERIVDQVVNPKIGKVFQPKIEDIVYKYLGIPKPAKVEAFSILHQLPSFPINGNSLKIDTSHLLPNDLEQISPDSDKATIRSDCRDDSLRVEMESKTDDEDESPPFEPIENSGATLYVKNDMSTRNMAADDVEREANKEEQRTYVDIATQDASSVSQKTGDHEYDHNLGICQESHSQLSHVSSNSCLSLETHDINNEFNIKSNDNAVNISEEAQMPRFNENSNEENSSKGEKKAELHFDIKQDEIKFEGTKRNLDLQLPEVASQMCESTNKNGQRGEPSKELSNVGILEDKSNKSSDHSFKFTKICVEGAHQSAKETTLHPSPDDSVNAHLCIVDKSDNTQLSTARRNTSLTQKSDDKEKGSLESHKELAVSNSASNLADKVEETSCGPNSSMTVSSSTSRHKKHSKTKSSKERHRDKDRSKDKEIIRAKEKSAHRSRSKSRHSQKKSSHRVTSNGTPTSELKSKSSKHSRRRDESKRSRHYDKRHHSSSSRQRDEKKKQSENKGDDHYASKDKIFWRKSTDSNDEDKDSENIGGKSKRSDHEKSGAIEKSKSKIENKKVMSSSGSNTIGGLEGSKQQAQLLSNDHENVPSKIFILNEVLENPTTNFIELGVASQECCINIVRSKDKKNIQSDQNNSENELHYFEEHSDQFRHRLKLIDYAIDTYRKVVNSLRYDSLSPPIADFPKTHSDMAMLPAPYLIPTGTKRNLNVETQATLHIDCIEYTKTSHRQQDFDEQPESKRLKYRQNQATLASPASSEASVNSKENEFMSTDVTGADGDCTKKSISLVERSSAALTKLSQQRYTNEDLYKPRLCLGQRSRRRGHLDAVI